MSLVDRRGVENFEVRPDGTILIGGQIAGHTNNPDEVRRRLSRSIRARTFSGRR